MTQDEMIQILRTEMDKQGVTDPELRAGIGAIAGGESGFQMKPELGYGHTANNRIRLIFGARVADLSDEELDSIKSNDEEFFNTVYGGTWGANNLGNTSAGDGYKFRGRGMFQLTGRSNYERYGKLIGVDLTTDPEVANQPSVAAAIAVAYMKDRYQGDGWEGMKRAVGNNIPDIDTTKNELYNKYLSDGTFGPIKVTDESNIVVGSPCINPEGLPGTWQRNPKGWVCVVEPQLQTPTSLVDPADEFVEAVKKVQTFLISKGLYRGATDGDFGPVSRHALQSYIQNR